MIRKYLENIEKNQDVRQNLIELRQALKTEKGREAWDRQRGRYSGVVRVMLNHDDAKTRRNAALILGEMGGQEQLGALHEAYEKEQQLFVRSAYLTAMSHLDYRPYLEPLKARLQELMQMEMSAENQKHLNEELKLLRDMLMRLEAPVKHRFTGYAVPSEVILLTSPGFEELTVDALPVSARQKAKAMTGGVMVAADRPGDLLGIRTMKGVLFRFCKNPLPANDYESVAASLMDAGIVNYLSQRHEGAAPFYFRIDLRTKLVLNEKSQYVKRLAARLEQLSGHQLQNSASNYECEIRIMENKEGRYNVYLKLDTIRDSRFAYRRHSLATSLHPVKAAEMIALAGPYLQENAAVLDPFCGTGTLLIERQRAVKAAHLYGVDIFGEAVAMGRENAELAHTAINFVNRDFADFTHAYLFDEILTELPAQSEKLSADQLYQLYTAFVRKIAEWMRPGGCVIVCTTEEGWMKRLAEKSGYLKTEAVYHLSGKRVSALMIMRYRG